MAVTVVLLCSLLATACGSTVRQDGLVQQDIAAADGGRDGFTAPATGSALDGASGVGGPGAVSTGSARVPGAGAPGSSPAGGGGTGLSTGASRSSSGSAPATGSPGGGSSGGGPGVPPAGGPPAAPDPAGASTGRGFDATTVDIGYLRVEDAGPFTESLGVDIGELTIDAEAVVGAIVEDINASGGLAGRQITLVPHTANAAELLTSPDTFSQAACATWTQDDQVFAVVSAVSYEQLVACLDASDTPLLWTSGIDIPRVRYQYFYDRYPDYYHIGGFQGEAYDRVAYRRLVERGFFEPWDTSAGAPADGPVAPPVKFGLVVPDDEEGRFGAEHTAQVLASHGLTLDAVAFIPPTNSAAAFASAALRFRSEGITHASSYGATFLSSANSQGYYPRMFIEQSLNFYALTYPDGLRGAMSASFIPGADTAGDAYPGHPNPAAYEPCLAVVQAAGVQPRSAQDHYAIQTACDSFYPMRAALDAAGGLSNDALRTGFTALGDRPVSSITWTSRFTDTRRASSAAVRDISFVADCTCWRYDSAVNHLAD